MHVVLSTRWSMMSGQQVGDSRVTGRKMNFPFRETQIRRTSPHITTHSEARSRAFGGHSERDCTAILLNHHCTRRRWVSRCRTCSRSRRFQSTTRCYLLCRSLDNEVDQTPSDWSLSRHWTQSLRHTRSTSTEIEVAIGGRTCALRAVLDPLSACQGRLNLLLPSPG
jgi:hypothetical protein